IGNAGTGRTPPSAVSRSPTPDSPIAAATGLSGVGDRKSTRLNSSHRTTSYAVFCLKKKSGKQNHDGDRRDQQHVLLPPTAGQERHVGTGLTFRGQIEIGGLPHIELRLDPFAPLLQA